MVAVTLSSSSLASRAALARPKALKRNSRVALRVRAKLETEDDTAEKTDAPTTEPGFLDGINNVIKSIWPGSDVANAFTAPKVNPAAKLFDANTMSEAERNALKRQYAQPTFLDGLGYQGIILKALDRADRSPEGPAGPEVSENRRQHGHDITVRVAQIRQNKVHH